MCKKELTFKEEYLQVLQNELERPFIEGMSKEELATYKEGINKSLMAFKRLAGGKEVLAVDLLLDEPLRRVVESEEL